MRPLTKDEERDNAEFKRLGKKIATRDAKRGAQEVAHKTQQAYNWTMREAGKGYGFIKKRWKQKRAKRFKK